jgi:hypothetical protein
MGSAHPYEQEGAMSPSHQTVRLTAGRHTNADKGVCVMELASMLAGERFTDRPRSVSPALASVLRGYNDGLDDERRQTLKRYASASIGTATGRTSEKRRRRLIGATIPQLVGARGARAALSRRLAATDPYTTVRGIAQRVAQEDDEVLHGRVLALIDALVAIDGRRPDPDMLLQRAGAEDPSPTSEPHAQTT